MKFLEAMSHLHEEDTDCDAFFNHKDLVTSPEFFDATGIDCQKNVLSKYEIY
jgi:hypothetical protein